MSPKGSDFWPFYNATNCWRYCQPICQFSVILNSHSGLPWGHSVWKHSVRDRFSKSAIRNMNSTTQSPETEFNLSQGQVCFRSAGGEEGRRIRRCKSRKSAKTFFFSLMKTAAEKTLLWISRLETLEAPLHAHACKHTWTLQDGSFSYCCSVWLTFTARITLCLCRVYTCFINLLRIWIFCQSLCMITHFYSVLAEALWALIRKK